MNGNLRVGNLFGIPFFVNVSWFLVLALVTWDYGGGLASTFPALSGATPWILGLVAALLLFASVLAHELGHSFVAMQQGIGVNSITLFLFGGLAALEKESDTPKGAFWVAIAGPLVSFTLFALFFTAGQVLQLAGPIGAIVSLLAYINLALGVFNLIPGLPLDGGNVLKSVVWKLTGNPYKGIVFASRVGQFIGWAAILTGVASLFGISSFGNIWTLLIGLFLLQNANRTAQSGEIQSRLEGLTAADAVTEDSPIALADVTLRDFADEALLSGNARWRRFLVVDAEDQLIGAVTVDTLRNIPKDEWLHKTVRDIMESADDLTTVESDQPLLEILRTLEEKQVRTLAVIRDNGALMGLLERTAIISLLQKPQANPA
jgi:Zn-dependent protease/CBS domain-containing protein